MKILKLKDQKLKYQSPILEDHLRKGRLKGEKLLKEDKHDEKEFLTDICKSGRFRKN